MAIDSYGCLNNTIKVASGHYVDLLNPDPATIDIESIAKALSKICRFGGHCPRFYSVAEHSILACNLALNDGVRGKELMAVLLHDAAEAYIGDMVKPLKVLMDQYRESEEKVEAAVAKRFNVNFNLFRGTIKRYDRAMLKAEKMFFWPHDTEEWSGFGEIEEVDVEIKALQPDDVERQFLLSFEFVSVL